MEKQKNNPIGTFKKENFLILTSYLGEYNGYQTKLHRRKKCKLKTEIS